MKNILKVILASTVAVCSAGSARADALDLIPHLTYGLVGFKIGDAILTARGVADLGLKFVSASDIPAEYNSFTEGSMEIELAQKLSSGATIGAIGKLHADFVANLKTGQTNLQSGDSRELDAFDLEKQKGLLYAQGAYGRVEAGYLHASGLAISGGSTVAGRGQPNQDGLTRKVSGVGGRYLFNSGSHTTQIQADRSLRGMVGYRWKRAHLSNTYTFGADAVYAHEEEFQLPAASGSVLSSRLARSFGAVLGGQVDYGTLSMSFGGGAEYFMATTGADDSEARLFASAGASKKWGRTTLSAAAAFERYLTTKYSEAELALGGEFALSRGLTLVGGYNMTYTLADQPPAGFSESTLDHTVEGALRINF